MIGNESDAQIAANIVVSYDNNWNVTMENAPDGWELLGEGCYRRAFRSADGVVYKVEYDRHAIGSNANEAKVFETFGDKVQGFRIAPCTLWGAVLAMHFYNHEWDVDYSQSVHEAAVWFNKVLGYRDVIGKDGENYHSDKDGVITVTDYAYDILPVPF